jgi:alkylhydroperoxidase/carboxymuconolactone decarboxylase family protein YurZ
MSAGSPGVDQDQEIGPWDSMALTQLREWDAAWTMYCVRMTTNPWTNAVLPRKFIELVSLALNAACTNLNSDGTRRHIRAALDAGATRDGNVAATPACDTMRTAGQWNAAWDPFFKLDPSWTDEFMATGVAIYGSSLFTPKEVELLSIAFDASYTHMYAPGTRRHIKGALKAGATMEEIMEVLKLCVVQGVQACNLGVPILAEELERS